MAAAGVLAGLCGLAAWFSRGGAEPQLPWYSIIPPAVAIVAAFLTHHVIFSLGIAIVLGGLLATVPAAPADAAAWSQGLATTAGYVAATVTDPTNLLILSFIPPIFVMVEIIIAAGGFLGIVRWLLRRIRSSRSAQLATALMGLVCWIDDYCSSIIVGSMMQPVTDRFRISREKLAFIVDATSAPVSGLAVVSTWIAYEVGLFADMSRQLGLGKTGYAMFFDALSFRFYCLLMLAFVFAHILLARDFGPMRKAEERVRAGGRHPEDAGAAQVESTPVAGDSSEAESLELAGSAAHTEAGMSRPQAGRTDSTAAPSNSSENAASFDPADPEAHWATDAPAPPAGRAVNALLPLGGLIGFHLTGLWIDGGGPAKLAGAGSLLSPTYWRDVISAAEHSHHMLLSAALFGGLLAALCGRLTGSLRPAAVPGCLYRGVRRALLPSVVLVLAWSLKNCCHDLGTGQFLTGLLAGHIPPHWFPPLLFAVACLVSFATGTSWGTMAILIPTGIPIAFALDGNTYGPTTIISLAAVLDGAIFGDHVSPISDTTILSSTASNCELLAHVRTQLPYSLTVAVTALTCAYIPSTLGLPAPVSLAFAALVLLALLLLTRRPQPAVAPASARRQPAPEAT